MNAPAAGHPIVLSPGELAYIGGLFLVFLVAAIGVFLIVR